MPYPFPFYGDSAAPTADAAISAAAAAAAAATAAMSWEMRNHDL